MVLTHDLLEDRCIDNLTIKNNFLFSSYETNRVNVAVALFSNLSHKTSIFSENVNDTFSSVWCATFLFLPHFDVILTYKTDNTQSIFCIKEGFVDLV